MVWSEVLRFISEPAALARLCGFVSEPTGLATATDASDYFRFPIPTLVEQCFNVLFSLYNHNSNVCTAKSVALFDCFCSAKIMSSLEMDK